MLFPDEYPRPKKRKKNRPRPSKADYVEAIFQHQELLTTYQRQLTDWYVLEGLSLKQVRERRNQYQLEANSGNIHYLDSLYYTTQQLDRALYFLGLIREDEIRYWRKPVRR